MPQATRSATRAQNRYAHNCYLIYRPAFCTAYEMLCFTLKIIVLCFQLPPWFGSQYSGRATTELDNTKQWNIPQTCACLQANHRLGGTQGFRDSSPLAPVDSQLVLPFPDSSIPALNSFSL